MIFFEVPRPLILGSQSPRRAQLLRQVGFDFEVIPPDVDEDWQAEESPEKVAVKLATQKAKAVAQKVKRGFVVGADTLVVLDGRFLGKPQNAAEAREMLQFLSGRTHEVFTGFAIDVRPEGRVVADWERTAVTFRRLETPEIERYIEKDRPFDKAGAYGIQDTSALFVESIHGSYYNVVGFPLTKFYVQLKNLVRTLEKDGSEG